jgi:hypothetical protein
MKKNHFSRSKKEESFYKEAYPHEFSSPSTYVMSSTPKKRHLNFRQILVDGKKTLDFDEGTSIATSEPTNFSREDSFIEINLPVGSSSFEKEAQFINEVPVEKENNMKVTDDQNSNKKEYCFPKTTLNSNTRPSTENDLLFYKYGKCLKSKVSFRPI